MNCSVLRRKGSYEKYFLSQKNYKVFSQFTMQQPNTLQRYYAEFIHRLSG